MSGCIEIAMQCYLCERVGMLVFNYGGVYCQDCRVTWMAVPDDGDDRDGARVSNQDLESWGVEG